jgi:hypothetical protein
LKIVVGFHWVKKIFSAKGSFFYRPNVFPSSYSLKFSLAVVWFQNLLDSNTGCNKLKYENMRKIQEMAWVKIPQPWSIFSQSSYILILLCCYIIILLNFETFLNIFFWIKNFNLICHYGAWVWILNKNNDYKNFFFSLFFW